ncbi:MAG: HAD hydrolase family protein [Actinomycetota bacterium]|nr:HAD hydrolase family protein [Actinomycetota bacterium]
MMPRVSMSSPKVRIVYSDLDGTMVGPRGSFWLDADRRLTDVPGRALLDLHRAGIDLVLVSGRTRLQLVEAGRIFGADGFIAELGSVVAWSGWREHQVLPGQMPASYGGRTPFDVMAALGIPDQLFARYPGRLEWHEPWNVGHEVDAMIRGSVDVGEVEEWLTARGWGWLTLRDNGTLPISRSTGLSADGLPAHVYHLMPRGLSKGVAVQWDLTRRGIDPADAIAIGDSISDLEMADSVSRLWLTSNGLHDPEVASQAAARDNVSVCDEAVGLGWAQAIRSILP